MPKAYRPLTTSPRYEAHPTLHESDCCIKQTAAAHGIGELMRQLPRAQDTCTTLLPSKLPLLAGAPRWHCHQSQSRGSQHHAHAWQVQPRTCHGMRSASQPADEEHKLLICTKHFARRGSCCSAEDPTPEQCTAVGLTSLGSYAKTVPRRHQHRHVRGASKRTPALRVPTMISKHRCCPVATAPPSAGCSVYHSHHAQLPGSQITPLHQWHSIQCSACQPLQAISATCCVVHDPD